MKAKKPRSKRAPYCHERRLEVNDIRKSGACLRCQLLKKPCSRAAPCERCIKAAAKNSSSRCLAWMDCVRPSLQKLSIYGSDISSLHDLALGGVPVLQYFADGDVQLKFDIPFQWNIDELSTFLAGWLLADQGFSTAASMVGIMSSASLYSTLSAIIGAELAQLFKILIHTTSSLYNTGCRCPKGQSESHDVKVIRYCGGRILQYLESRLRPSQLAKLTRHMLYAAFLLLLGTVIASNYFEETLGVDTTTEEGIGHKTGSVGAELVRLLSHYVVYIGQQTGLIHSGLDYSTTRDLLLFETKKPQSTWEPTHHSRSNCHRDREPEDGKIPDRANIYDNAHMGDLMPPNSLPSVRALPFIGNVSWDLEIPTLDTVALRLIETSDSDIFADRFISNQKDLVETQRKDSLGSDLFLEENTFQTWHHGIPDNDFPTAGVSSGLFEVDGDESWPCLNRIPSPSPSLPEMNGLVEDISWETLMQDVFPLASCGILPSCSSSVPSVSESTYDSPRPARRRSRLGGDRTGFLSAD